MLQAWGLREALPALTHRSKPGGPELLPALTHRSKARRADRTSAGGVNPRLTSLLKIQRPEGPAEFNGEEFCRPFGPYTVRVSVNRGLTTPANVLSALGALFTEPTNREPLPTRNPQPPPDLRQAQSCLSALAGSKARGPELLPTLTHRSKARRADRTSAGGVNPRLTSLPKIQRPEGPAEFNGKEFCRPFGPYTVRVSVNRGLTTPANVLPALRA